MSPRRGPQLPYSVIAGVTPWATRWVVATAKIGGAIFAPESPKVFDSFSEILSETPTFSIVVVYAPIGYHEGPDFKIRTCDREARALLGKRSSTIRNAPTRSALAEGSKLENSNLDAVSLKLLPRYREVANLMSPYRQRVVYEGNPELSFYQLNKNSPLRWSKNKENGAVERLLLLEGKIPNINSIIEESAKTIKSTHLLDAIALLWTARRVYGHAAQRIPSEGEWDSEGLRVEIVL